MFIKLLIYLLKKTTTKPNNQTKTTTIIRAAACLVQPFFILAYITCSRVKSVYPPFPPLFPDVSLQLPWLTANSFITGHKRQVLHLKRRHPPSPPAQVKNWPAGIAHRTHISSKQKPAGPKRRERGLSSRGTNRQIKGTVLWHLTLCSFIHHNECVQSQRKDAEKFTPHRFKDSWKRHA